MILIEFYKNPSEISRSFIINSKYFSPNNLRKKLANYIKIFKYYE